MKTLKIIALLMCAFPMMIMAQEGTPTLKDSSQTTEEDLDTFKITTARKKILITPREDIEIEEEVASDKKEQRMNHFEGIDIGINGFMSASNSVDLPDEAKFMDLNYAKSITVSFNYWEAYIPIAKEKFGIATGLGIEFNNYDLSRDITVFSDRDTTMGVSDPTKDIEKNKFKSTMLNFPVMFETNIGKDAEHSFYLQAGGMLAYRVGSKTKQIFDQAGKEQKVKDRTDFNMNPFRFNLVARVGYGGFTAFATYSMTPIFDDEGPELYPFTVGLSLNVL